MIELDKRMSDKLPSPFGRGVGGEGIGGEDRTNSAVLLANRPHPGPLRAPTVGWSGEGTKRRRRGAILVVVLVCLAVAAALSVVVVRQLAMEHHAVQMSQRSLQAWWLAEAGIERAAAQLATDPKYAGETWIIPAKELAAGDDGVVRIQVQTIAGRPERHSVRVEADYPAAPAYRCRQIKQIVVDRDAILSRQPTKAGP